MKHISGLMIRIYILVSLLANPISALAQDSLKIKELKGVEVKAKRGWFDEDKAVFIPTRKEKNIASNAEGLIRAMNLPMVRDVGGSLESSTGAKVVIFINGVRANEVDLATFWPKEAKRVEYYDHPSNPTFEGCAAVINFIMPRHATGGVGKIELTQGVPSFGQYRASTKAERGKMSYGALFNSNYSRRHGDHTTGEEIYSDIYYNGNQYESLTNKKAEQRINRGQFISGAVNARYSTERFRATHTLQFMWIRNPNSSICGINRWNPGIFGSESSESASEGHSQTPTIRGDYYAKTSEKSTLTAWWAYSYSRNDNDRTSRTGELASIFNSTKDDTHSLRFNLRQQFDFSPKFSGRLMLDGDMNRYKTRYYGSSDAIARQQQGKVTAFWRMDWSPTPKFRFMFIPGVRYDHLKTSANDKNDLFNAMIGANMTYTPISTFQLGVQAGYQTESQRMEQMADVTIRKDELTWLRGNPDLSDRKIMSFTIHGTWMPTNRLSVMPIVAYSSQRNETCRIYERAPESMGGVIETYENASRRDGIQTQLYLQWTLLNGKLTLVGLPQLTSTRYDGTMTSFANYFSVTGQVNYYFGNFMAMAKYASPQKSVGDGGLSRLKQTDSFMVSVNYGKGDWNVELLAENLFHKFSNNKIEYDSGVFARNVNEYIRGRNVTLRVVYTFGYGKRVSRTIDIDSPGAISSGSLKY